MIILPVDGVNSNNTTSTENTRTTSNKSLNTGLDVNDFLQLLASQLSNQDMMNPMKDTEFMSQLAQFTQLEAINNLVDTSMTSYAASLIGKEITAASITSRGELNTKTGVVTGVSLFEGEPIVYIDNEHSFKLPEIMAVGKLPTAKETDPEDGNGSKD